MGDAGFYRGTNSDQDSRFTDKEKKLLKSMKFENKLDVKVDLQRVNIEVIKPWITTRLNELLGVEDEVVVEYVFSLLEDSNLNPKVMQINLTGFLNARRSREFMAELWELLDEAQKADDGIPPCILQKKIQEMKNAGAVKTEVKTEPEECDWKNRYTSLTGGHYGSSSSNRYEDRRSRGGDEDRGRDRRTNDRERRGDDDRERDRKRERLRRSRSRSKSPRRRRRSSRSPQTSRSNRRRSRSTSESREKRRRTEDHKSRHRSTSRSPRRRESSSDRQHRNEKHKKEKKAKSDRDRD